MVLVKSDLSSEQDSLMRLIYIEKKHFGTENKISGLNSRCGPNSSDFNGRTLLYKHQLIG